MVHEAEVDLARRHRLDDRRVLLVEAHAVVLHRLEPRPRLLLALRQPHDGDEGLERRVRRRNAHTAVPARIGEVEHRVRDLVLRELVGVVGDDPRAARRPTQRPSESLKCAGTRSSAASGSSASSPHGLRRRASPDPGRRTRPPAIRRPPRRSSPRARRCRRSAPRRRCRSPSSNCSMSGATSSSSRPE